MIMSACKVVTIKANHELYKKGEPATSIELVELEEVGNTIVAEKGRYMVGDQVLFIQPDYCLPDTPNFSEFYYPGGDASKSRLGSHGRIKAIKFNLSLAPDNNDPVYSYGIVRDLTPDVLKFIGREDELDKIIGITKWSEPEEKTSGGGVGGSADSAPFPEGLYKTDEENINNVWNTIKYPVELIGTQKIDGSSITSYCKQDSKGKWKAGICSRTLEKKLVYKKVVGFKKPTILQWIKKNIFRKEIDLRIFNLVPATSDFVVVGGPYLKLLEEYCKQYNEGISLRGELCGKGLRGSGNKNNPTVTETPHVEFYAADDIDNGIARRMGEHMFDALVGALGVKRCPILFTETFNSREEIEAKCQEMFDYFKSQKILIEGVVLKTLDGKWSAKLMNLEYDAKK
jgi:hypothetical protein